MPTQTRSSSITPLAQVESLTDRVDLSRAHASSQLDPGQRSQMGQFFTPPDIARFMASLFNHAESDIRLLDPGAGVGSLTAAFVEDAVARPILPTSIAVVAYEIDPMLAGHLRISLDDCTRVSEVRGIPCSWQVIEADFIETAVDSLTADMVFQESRTFNRVIMNPPYRKIRRDSQPRRLLRRIGVETGNLYAGFLSLAIHLLEPGGELVAITPRSFCNGPYFRSFRRLFLDTMALQRIHVFESRDRAFQKEDVLQENIIFHAVKDGTPDTVRISSSHGPEDELLVVRTVDYDRVVRPGDSDRFIHVVTSELDRLVLDRLSVFQHSLKNLDISVSTGRVVDFRATEYLRPDPEEGTVPLIYPTHFKDGFVDWPLPGNKKPNAIVHAKGTDSLMLPSGHYVLVKRFTAKEERRRLVAALCDPRRLPDLHVGFENHLNVYHRDNRGLPPDLAKGLAVYLNSTLVDSYFRQFSGHTQVNATDLRRLNYPSPEVLQALGEHVGDHFPSQTRIDSLLEAQIQQLADIRATDPAAAKAKIAEARGILRDLGLSRELRTERYALALLALLDLEPEKSWTQASEPAKDVLSILDFCRDHYGREYAPATRERVCRQTMDDLVSSGLAAQMRSSSHIYQRSTADSYRINPAARDLLRTFDTSQWESALQRYLGPSSKPDRQKVRPIPASR